MRPRPPVPPMATSSSRSSIASAFSMYNRMVDGLPCPNRAHARGLPRPRFVEIAENGYSAPSNVGRPAAPVPSQG